MYRGYSARVHPSARARGRPRCTRCCIIHSVRVCMSVPAGCRARLRGGAGHSGRQCACASGRQGEPCVRVHVAEITRDWPTYAPKTRAYRHPVGFVGRTSWWCLCWPSTCRQTGATARFTHRRAPATVTRRPAMGSRGCNPYVWGIFHLFQRLGGVVANTIRVHTRLGHQRSQPLWFLQLCGEH